MILVVGVVLGLIAGFIRALLSNQSYELPVIRHMELLLLAFVPQAIVFFVPQTGRLVSQEWAMLILPVSLALLMLFAWVNRRITGFGILGAGLLLNFAVITANGGLMPISPETLAIVHGAQAAEQSIAELGASRDFGAKSVVLSVEETRLEWLGDRFTVPEQLPIQFAYSVGDVFLAVGAFWVLWVGGAPRRRIDPEPQASIPSPENQARVSRREQEG